METQLRDNDIKVGGPDDGRIIVRKAHAEVQSAQKEARVAHEELCTAREVFNQKVEQITSEHTIALDQSKTVINSLKSEVNRPTPNVKLDGSVAVNVAPNRTEAPSQLTNQPLSGSGYQTPANTPARSLSPSSSQVTREMLTYFILSSDRCA